MSELKIHILSQFFKLNGGRPEAEFLEEFDGAFVLTRSKGSVPLIVFLPREEGFKVGVGSDEDSDLDFEHDPTMDPNHCEVAYHTGFKGWTIEDLGSSFGTHVDSDRLGIKRPTLLRDRCKIQAGGGLTELQFYTAETIYTRMAKAGITRSLRRKGLEPKKSTQPDMPVKSEDEPDDG